MGDWKERWSKWLSRAEQKGFRTANTMHRVAINCILLYIGYNIFTFFRDYNDFFLNARKIDAQEAPPNDDEPINRITSRK